MRVLTALVAAACFAGCRGRAEVEAPEEPEAAEPSEPSDATPPPGPTTIVQEASVTTTRTWTLDRILDRHRVHTHVP